MAVRPIDGNELYRIEKLLDTDIIRQDKVALNLLEQVLYDIQHVPTLAPPNEPLTLDELLKMDGQPVWVELHQAWALVEVKQNGSVMFYGNSFSCSYSRTWQVYRFRPYRRPPEGAGNA